MAWLVDWLIGGGGCPLCSGWQASPMRWFAADKKLRLAQNVTAAMMPATSILEQQEDGGSDLTCIVGLPT
jgi:hypothetical protein